MPYTWDTHEMALDALGGRVAGLFRQAVARRPDMTEADLIRLVGQLTDEHGRAAAGSALLALEDGRINAGVVDSLPRPDIAPPAPAAQVSRSASSAWAAHGGQMDRLVRILSGSLDRMVRQPARETIHNATTAARTGFMRVPEPGACAFCLMLSSRGAVYSSETVSTTSGARGGKRPEGLQFHDDCRCSARESLSPSDVPQVLHDLQSEWQTYAGGDDQLVTWRKHVRENPPRI